MTKRSTRTPSVKSLDELTQEVGRELREAQRRLRDGVTPQAAKPPPSHGEIERAIETHLDNAALEEDRAMARQRQRDNARRSTLMCAMFGKPAKWFVRWLPEAERLVDAIVERSNRDDLHLTPAVLVRWTQNYAKAAEASGPDAPIGFPADLRRELHTLVQFRQALTLGPMAGPHYLGDIAEAARARGRSAGGKAMSDDTKVKRIEAEWNKLRKAGHEPRAIASIVATRLKVSAQYVREVVRKKKRSRA